MTSEKEEAQRILDRMKGNKEYSKVCIEEMKTVAEGNGNWNDYYDVVLKELENL